MLGDGCVAIACDLRLGNQALTISCNFEKVSRGGRREAADGMMLMFPPSLSPLHLPPIYCCTTYSTDNYTPRLAATPPPPSLPHDLDELRSSQ